MIPSTDTDLVTLEVTTQPTRTYAFDAESGRIRGTVSGLAAMEQAIYLILNTERYKHMIYSWNYGVELVELIGQPKSYAMPELKRYIEEALTQDDRISSVDSFEFTATRKTLQATFTVHTTFGDIETEVEI